MDYPLDGFIICNIESLIFILSHLQLNLDVRKLERIRSIGNVLE